jgi:protein TonB
MEAKKTSEADLENKRTVFFLMGLAVVLSAFYVLLAWRSDYSDDSEISELLAPVFIENEFDADIPTDTEKEQMVEQPMIEPEKQEPAVYEDYEIVEKVSPEKQENALNEQNQNLDSETNPNFRTDAQKESEADTTPQFPGGKVALIRFIYSHIQYPSVALQQRIQGRVWCSFLVDRDGMVSDVALEQGVYIFLDEEAVRVLKTMPPWIPGKTQGKNVKMKVYLPVVFKISSFSQAQ